MGQGFLLSGQLLQESGTQTWGDVPRGLNHWGQNQVCIECRWFNNDNEHLYHASYVRSIIPSTSVYTTDLIPATISEAGAVTFIVR